MILEYSLGSKGQKPFFRQFSFVSFARALQINCSDESGVLTGRWDGCYEDGISPTKWTGSVAILQKYMETGGTPVSSPSPTLSYLASSSHVSVTQ